MRLCSVHTINIVSIHGMPILTPSATLASFQLPLNRLPMLRRWSIPPISIRIHLLQLVRRLLRLLLLLLLRTTTLRACFFRLLSIRIVRVCLLEVLQMATNLKEHRTYQQRVAGLQLTRVRPIHNQYTIH